MSEIATARRPVFLRSGRVNDRTGDEGGLTLRRPLREAASLDDAAIS
jgi:hypothetical protein